MGKIMTKRYFVSKKTDEVVKELDDKGFIQLIDAVKNPLDDNIKIIIDNKVRTYWFSDPHTMTHALSIIDKKGDQVFELTEEELEIL